MLLCQMKTEACSGSYAQKWPKERFRNYPKSTEISHGPSNLIGNCISVWTRVPGEEIKITSSRYFPLEEETGRKRCI